MNLPDVPYRDPVGEPLAAFAQRNAVYRASLAEDLGWVMRSRRRERVSLLTWLGGIAKARSRAWWNWNDPLHAVRAFLHPLGQVFARKGTGPDSTLSVRGSERLTQPAPAGHACRTDR